MKLYRSEQANGLSTEHQRHEKSVKHPLRFRHTKLLYNSVTRSPIQQEALKNRLNYIHFKNYHIFLVIKRNNSPENVIERIYPEKCIDDLLTCRWIGANPSPIHFAAAEDLHLLIDDGLEIIIVPATWREISGQTLTLQLPEIGYYTGRRNAKRYACQDIDADLLQDEFAVHGRLADFSRIGFRIKVRKDAAESSDWPDVHKSVTIRLRNQSGIFYRAECRIIRRRIDPTDMEFVVAPANGDFTRFEKKAIRNPRQQLKPSPVLIFKHPILDKKIQIDACDISTSGFSVIENTVEGVLISGLIIEGLVICFVGSLCIRCDVQIIYRLDTDAKNSRVGIAILDMDANAYTDLTRVLTKAIDSNASVAGEVDLDALWEFFFEAGFIYPKKYGLIRSYRQEFKKIYTKLYQENPEIAKHFIYQKNGRIYGHISMLRVYERSWLIHHHVARSNSLRAGFQVLRQITHYINDLCRYPSTKIDFLMSFFRPDNKFPVRVFGGFARSLKNPRRCSVDEFTYLPHTTLSLSTQLPKDWRLDKSTSSDLLQLNNYYDHRSRGLLLRAMNLNEEHADGKSLEGLYRQQGLFRKQEVYSLSCGDDLAAVIVLNYSNPGINLSELMNSMIVFIIKPSDLPWKTLSIGIGHLSRPYTSQRIPLMFYPASYVARERIPYEKIYRAWVFDTSYGNDWLEYMQETFKAVY